MDGNLSIWFNLTTYFLGITFLFLGYKIKAKKQISLLGNIGELKKKDNLNTVCTLACVYSVLLGASIIVIPVVNLVLNLYAVMALVGLAIIGSMIFWLILSRVYFSPSVKQS
ncbi:hypothetical protein [Virgibacillus sp. CBA3643]|uniref:hypothetical protein n=1 Tax=Virgibacillus sp. CBA3643 TaxID=2942278 RepID=UPI0035A298C7